MKVIVLTGPTGIGKTNLSLELAKLFHGEIINADASQFRKGLTIGTAKIDTSTTIIPHHLLDFLDPTEEFSIKEYQEMARKQIEQLSNQGKTIFMVGGSGLYIRAALEDYYLGDNKRLEEVEKEYSEWSNEQLHAVLEQLDPASYQKIHPNNRRRVLRAIQIALSGEPLLSENISHHQYLFKVLQICLITNRDTLYERINARVDSMMEAGWMEEIQSLVKQGVPIEQIKEIGYVDIYHHLLGDKTLEEVKESIKQKTRRYAKRQMTWFRNQMECEFVEMNYDDPTKTLDEAVKMVQNFLEQ